MKTFLVGGAVRDQLLGIKPKDLDYVVTDVSHEQLLNLGFEQVGNSYTVFLHPQTKEQYTLCENGIEEDLARRDLTINAMAMDEQHQLIDPYKGRKDLEERILRHTSERFAEDPLRILRVARFKARYPEFSIAPETLTLMKAIATTREFALLSPERIFQELKGALSMARPSLFFEVLKSTEALRPWFQELASLIDVPQRPEYHPEGDCWVHTMLVIDQAARISDDLRLRFAALVHDLGKGITPKDILPKHIAHEQRGLPLVKAFSGRLKIPNEWLEAGLVVTENHLKVHRLSEMKANTIVKMFYEMDAFRKPWLVGILARAAEADDMGKLRQEVPQGKLLEKYFACVQEVSAADVQSDVYGKELGEKIREERVRRLRELSGPVKIANKL